MIVTAYNPPTKPLEKTFLSAYHAAAVTSLNVKNNQNFANNKRILIGEMGRERSEIRTCNGITGSTQVGLGAATSFPHDPDDPVYILRFDQVKFYRADSENGSYSAIATVDVDVDNADKLTLYDDTTGTASKWYKTSYIHSISGVESDLSDPVQAGRYARAKVGYIIDSAAKKVGDPNHSILTIEDCLDVFNWVNDDLLTQRERPYRFLRKVATLNTVADQNYIEFPSDFYKFRMLKYAYNTGGQTVTAKVDPVPEDIYSKRNAQSNALTSDDLNEIFIDYENERILLGPTPRTSRTGVITLYYFKYFNEINSLGDIVETPTTALYYYRLLEEWYTAKSETDDKFIKQASNYGGKYNTEVMKLQRTNNLDAGSAQDFLWAPRKWLR